MILTPTTIFQEKEEAAAPPAAQLLIDEVGVSARLAIGLRKLRSAYSGDAIEVRRASDNATQDIGFSGEDLDTSALATFCAGTNGYIRTWYDQSGNGYDIVQTTNGLQALIYDSSAGVITTSNGSVACRTTEVGDTSATGDYVYQSPNLGASTSTPTICLVAERISFNVNGLIHAEAQNGFAFGTYNNNNSTDSSKINTIRSNGSVLASLSTIANGDTFGFYYHMVDQGAANSSEMIGSSDPGLGNGGTKASNTVQFAADGWNASAYDDFQLFYCCAPVLYQNMYLSEFVYWEPNATGLSSTEQDDYFNNINTYYSLQF